MDFSTLSISISLGTLGAVVYALRMMHGLDRKVTRLLEHQGIKA